MMELDGEEGMRRGGSWEQTTRYQCCVGVIIRIVDGSLQFFCSVISIHRAIQLLILLILNSIKHTQSIIPIRLFFFSSVASITDRVGIVL